MEKELKNISEEIKESLEVNERGMIKRTRRNCMLVLKNEPFLEGKIKKNLLTDRVDIGDVPWRKECHSLDDDDLHQIYLLFEEYGIVGADKMIDSAIRLVADENKYHPIRDYLESLVWDGISRVEDAMQHFLGVKRTSLSEEALKVFMFGALERIYNPGCKFELMLCLVGGQGDGKSAFFRMLALNDEWFTDDVKRLDDENIVRRLQGHWIVEMAEMIPTASVKSIEENKAFLSRQKDTYKVPYDKYPKDVKRQCVFAGTSNKMNFLPFDRTGNRRFVPLETCAANADCHIYENEQESRKYFEQMWAEMMVFYKKGMVQLYLSNESEQQLAMLREMYMGEDTDKGLIEEYLESNGKTEICVLELYQKALKHEKKPDRRESNDIADILRNAIGGWVDSAGKTKRFKDYGIQKYFVKVTNQQENINDDFVLVSEQMELPFD